MIPQLKAFEGDNRYKVIRESFDTPQLAAGLFIDVKNSSLPCRQFD